MQSIYHSHHHPSNDLLNAARTERGTMELPVAASENSSRRRPLIPFRRRRVLSPFTRGLLLAAVFLLWCGLSTFYYGGPKDSDVAAAGDRVWTGTD